MLHFANDLVLCYFGSYPWRTPYSRN